MAAKEKRPSLAGAEEQAWGLGGSEYFFSEISFKERAALHNLYKRLYVLGGTFAVNNLQKIAAILQRRDGQ